MCKACSLSPLLKAIDAFLAKADDDLSDELAAQGFVDADSTVDAINSVEDQVADILTNETDIITSELSRASSVEDFMENVWPRLQEADAVADELYEAFYALFQEQVPGLATSYIQGVDELSSVETVRLRTVDWMQSHSVEVAQQMKLTSHNQISRILTTAIDDGKGVAEATQAILDSGIRNERYRARACALTEMLTAHSAAASEAYAQSPAVSARQWRHTGSYRNKPRENHQAMDGVQVANGEPYTLLGADGSVYAPMYPRDPMLPPGERINCHCIEQPVVDENILGLPLEERKARQQTIVDEDDLAWEEEADNAARERAEAWRAEHSTIDEE